MTGPWPRMPESGFSIYTWLLAVCPKLNNSSCDESNLSNSGSNVVQITLHRTARPSGISREKVALRLFPLKSREGHLGGCYENYLCCPAFFGYIVHRNYTYLAS